MVEVCPICKGVEGKESCGFCGGYGTVHSEPVEGRLNLWKYHMADRVGGYNGREDTREMALGSDQESRVSA
jgi:hypothetical protein